MNQFKKVAFYTLGCKLNFAETSSIARQFRESGYARVESDENPDVLIINTCSVTDQADKKCRNIVSRAIRQNPGVHVAVIGCYAQLKPEEIASIPGVDIVLGANEKFNIVQHIEDAGEKGKAQILAGEIKEVKTFIPSFSHGDRTRTFLKVQDGCNYFCAFCTIPLARGRSRSATISETMIEARKAVDAGAKEIVLTGVNIGDFGTAHGETFFDLVKQLDELEGVDRFRISSIEPNLLTDEIIDFVAKSKRFMPHFHIPLQSGSDSILQIKTAIPDCCIGVDVIVGFPGETDALFEETYSFLTELDISYLHVFTYSERDNTTALRIQEVVPMDVRHERNKRLRILSEKKKHAFYERFENTVRPALWEGENEDGMMFGFTDNYIKVTKPFLAQSSNQISKFELKKINGDGIYTGQEVIISSHL
jgi:threonylcarbamoyladenosine tRNA methylthiotransferase MtaB